MINNINLYSNIQIPQNLAFRAKQEYSPMTSPIENQNISGADALASYNSVLVNNRNFNIPLLKPVEIPGDINAIEGERIYNSKGVLECIVKEVNNKKYVYSYNSNDFPGINNLEIYDNNTGNKIFEQAEYRCTQNGIEHRNMYITEYDPITGLETSSSSYEDMQPVMKQQITKYNSDCSSNYISYHYDTAEYSVGGKSSINTYCEKTYDINGKLKKCFYDEYNENGVYRQEITCKNGKEVSNEITERQAVINSEYEKYIKNPELTPAECPEFITSIENIEGEKTYYSNGQLESVRTSDGKLYETSFNGNSIALHDGNKTIEFSNIKENARKFCTIEEDFGNATKRTMYSGKNGNALWSVDYTKGNIEKSICYDEHGKPSRYSEADISNNDWRSIIDIEYAPNGGVLEVREGNDFMAHA